MSDNFTEDAVSTEMPNTKVCKKCGERIHADAVVCPKCGCQVEQMANNQPNIVINNTNENVNANTNVNAIAGVRMVNKWVAFFLCLFLGFLGAHKFYEGKIGMGILYLFTCGLFGIGWFVSLISILTKPNPYAVF